MNVNVHLSHVLLSLLVLHYTTPLHDSNLSPLVSHLWSVYSEDLPFPSMAGGQVECWHGSSWFKGCRWIGDTPMALKPLILISWGFSPSILGIPVEPLVFKGMTEGFEH